MTVMSSHPHWTKFTYFQLCTCY